MKYNLTINLPKSYWLKKWVSQNGQTPLIIGICSHCVADRPVFEQSNLFHPQPTLWWSFLYADGARHRYNKPHSPSHPKVHSQICVLPWLPFNLSIPHKIQNYFQIISNSPLRFLLRVCHPEYSLRWWRVTIRNRPQVTGRHRSMTTTQYHKHVVLIPLWHDKCSNIIQTENLTNMVHFAGESSSAWHVSN